MVRRLDAVDNRLDVLTRIDDVGSVRCYDPGFVGAKFPHAKVHNSVRGGVAR